MKDEAHEGLLGSTRVTLHAHHPSWLTVRGGSVTRTVGLRRAAHLPELRDRGSLSQKGETLRNAPTTPPSLVPRNDRASFNDVASCAACAPGTTSAIFGLSRRGLQPVRDEIDRQRDVCRSRPAARPRQDPARRSSNIGHRRRATAGARHRQIARSKCDRLAANHANVRGARSMTRARPQHVGAGISSRHASRVARATGSAGRSDATVVTRASSPPTGQ